MVTFTATHWSREMSIQLAMVGLVVNDMAKSLEFYRRLGLEIPEGEESKPFVMHRMPSGVTLFFDTVFAATSDPERKPTPAGTYNIMLEFYAKTRERVDALHSDLTGHGYVSRRAPWETPGPYCALVEDPDGNAVLITAEDDTADI
jgi:predicted lactoylglutathione lyase